MLCHHLTSLLGQFGLCLRPQERSTVDPTLRTCQWHATAVPPGSVLHPTPPPPKLLLQTSSLPKRSKVSPSPRVAPSTTAAALSLPPPLSAGARFQPTLCHPSTDKRSSSHLNPSPSFLALLPPSSSCTCPPSVAGSTQSLHHPYLQHSHLHSSLSATPFTMLFTTTSLVTLLSVSTLASARMTRAEYLLGKREVNLMPAEVSPVAPPPVSSSLDDERAHPTSMSFESQIATRSDGNGIVAFDRVRRPLRHLLIALLVAAGKEEETAAGEAEAERVVASSSSNLSSFPRR